MIPLTRIDRPAYECLLKDGKMPVQQICDKYGAAWVFRLQGILCAMAVHQCSEDAKTEGIAVSSADELFDLVSRFDYGSIFEENRLGDINPSDVLLRPMLYSMCQAETGDYEVGA